MCQRNPAETPTTIRTAAALRLSLGIAALSLVAVSGVLAGTVNYTYDDAGRLIGADYGDNRSITYRYDANGNLTHRVAAGVDGIFVDGFESGDAGGWSGVAGRPGEGN